MSREKISALLLGLISLLYFYGTYQMPEFTYVSQTPGKYYTYCLGASLVFLSFLLFVRNDIAGRKWEISSAKLKKLGVIIGILLAMLPTFKYLGIIITFTVGSTIISRFLGWKRWSSGFIVFGLINILIFLLFTKLLGIYLPLGKWPDALLFMIQGEG